jgi:tetratricopeptide (TPR) repeat protein
MSDEGSPLSLEQVRAAAAVGRLAELARQLVADRRWSSLEVLLSIAATPSLPLEDVVAALSAVLQGLGELPEADAKEAALELRQAQLHAASALARRADRSPLTDRERGGLRASAGLLAGLGELRRAAELYEKAGDDLRASETWGALGELDRMEACLAREETRRQSRLRVSEARRAFETLSAAGERQQAVRVALELREADPDSHELQTRGRQMEARLCRGRGVSLRLADGRVLGVAGLPATLGRDPTVELPVREPSVSRHHARLSAEGAQVAIEDLGSRGGTRLGGFPLAGRLPLRGAGEIALGSACGLRYRALGDGLLELRGSSGLDREHWSLVGASDIELGPALGWPTSLRVTFRGGVARLERALDLLLRVDGQLIGRGCDLLHGDRIETPSGERLEVL